nr:hypothetical protein [Holospora undulata]
MIKHHFDSDNRSKYNKKEGVNESRAVVNGACYQKIFHHIRRYIRFIDDVGLRGYGKK